MFDTICDRIRRDTDYPARTRTLDIRTRVLDGKLYDVLPHQFHEERNLAGEYIPLKDRKPNTRYNMCRIVVDDSVSMLFGEGRFPLIHCADEDTRVAYANLVKETHLVETMCTAAIRGSVGSVAVLMRILKSRVFFDAMETKYLTPAWDPEEPDTLLNVTEKYKVNGAALRAIGYKIRDDDLGADFWFQRKWDATYETWYKPWLVNGGKTTGRGRVTEQVDTDKTVRHNLGFVPIAWIRNLPGGTDKVDGECTFHLAIDTQIELEYQLSQAGRGLKYSSDPLLMIREPAMGDEKQLVRSASSALVVSKDGDAKLLEIDGSAAAAVLEYCRGLREFALETMHGNRSNADKLSAAQSGRALELLHQSLVWLTDRLRTTYGENGLLSLIKMVTRASEKMDVKIDGEKVKLNPKGPVSLKWGAWFPATENDRQQQAAALQMHRETGNLSRETAVHALAQNYEIEDVTAELTLIEADQQAEDKRLIAVENAKIQGKVNVTT
jgi:hypothetical protein